MEYCFFAIETNGHTHYSLFSIYIQSVAVLSVTHGSDHTLIAECKVLMSDLYSELSQTSNKDS